MSKSSMRLSDISEDAGRLSPLLPKLSSIVSVESWSLQDDPSDEFIRPPKRVLTEEERACPDYLNTSESDSFVLNHPLFPYPHLNDPGIKSALLNPTPAPDYPADGKDLYLVICEEYGLCPVRLFYNYLTRKEINLSYYGLNPSGMTAMAKALAVNPFVERLNLKDNFLNLDACYHLGEIFKTNRTLEELNLEGCRIGYAGLIRLMAHLSHKNALSHLNLARNCLEDRGGEECVDIISYRSKMRHINLSDNRLGSKTALKLADFFSYNNPLTHICLSRNDFASDTESMLSMLDAISGSDILEEIDISRNWIGGLRAARSVEKMLRNKKLRALNISHNAFGGPSIEIVVSGLSRARGLKILNLSDNPLTPEEALEVLKKMILRRISIETLMLENITVTKEFLNMLERVKSLPHRENFTCVFGSVLPSSIRRTVDPRELILKRAAYLGAKLDVPAYLMKICKELGKTVEVKELFKEITNNNVPFDIDFVEELSYVFPGKKADKKRFIDLNLLKDYVKRLWPHAKPIESSITPKKNGKRSGK